METIYQEFSQENIPPRYIELITNKGIALTKIPNGEATISDLFVLRMEDGGRPFLNIFNFNHYLILMKINLQKAFKSFFSTKKAYLLVTEKLK